jgi:hypothetical protein
MWAPEPGAETPDLTHCGSTVNLQPGPIDAGGFWPYESVLDEGKKPMTRISMTAGLLLLLGACNATPEEQARMEWSEDMEETVGNERTMVQAEDGGGEGVYYPPNAEEDVEMQSEPYPE